MDTGLAQTEGLLAYDVDRYILRHEILPGEKAITGSSTIELTVVAPMETLELDFDGAFDISRVESGGVDLNYTQDARKLYVDLASPPAAGDELNVTVYYSGKPVEAERPPWEGGFVWEQTPSGQPWVSTAIQGEGCDVWFPCKDHPLGEPRKGVELYITVPAGLTVASNGVLQGVEEMSDGRSTFHWRTDVSTNIYGVALNIAPYVLFEDTYQSVNGTEIPVRFWAIEDREDQARNLFESEFAKIIEFLSVSLAHTLGARKRWALQKLLTLGWSTKPLTPTAISTGAA